MNDIATAYAKSPLELAASLMPVAVAEGRLQELMEAARLFPLKAGESVTLLPGEGVDVLQVMSGTVRLTAAGDESLALAAGQPGADRVALPRDGRSITVQAESDSLVCHIDQEKFDFLVLWESLSEGVYDDPELQRRMAKFRHVQAFRRLPAESVQEAVRRMERVAVKAGDEVIRQYAAGDAFYVIDSGEAEVWVEEFPGDDAEMVNRLEEGDAFGEDALVTGKQRTATVRMRSDGTLLKLSKEDFQELIGGTMIREVAPEVAKAMLDDGYRLLDVRYEEEFDEEYIPDCLLLPLGELRRRTDELDRDGRYVVYCRSGKRSAVGALILSQLGIDAVSMKGGMLHWPYEKASNIPVPPPRP